MMQGAKGFDRWVRRFGFGKPTGVDLPGEEQGIVLPLEQYSGSSMGNLPIGQGIAVTPMQMATGYSAIANGGVLRPPHIVQSVGDRDGAQAEGPPGRSRRAPPPSCARCSRACSARAAPPPAPPSPATTWPARPARRTSPTPSRAATRTTKYVASFVGFAPADRPRVLVAVMVDEPQGEIYGGLVAGPAFRKIMSFALNYLRIPPD